MSSTATTPIHASAALGALFDGLRATGTTFMGSNKQLTLLLVDALDYLTAAEVPDPDSGAQAVDTKVLARALEAIAKSLPGEGSYSDVVNPETAE